SRRDIDAVAVDAVILNDHVAQVDADPSLDALRGLSAGIDGSLRLLDSLRAAHGVDHAVELAEHRVARGVNDSSLVRLDESLCAVVEFTNQCRSPFFVPPHHTAEAGNVDHEDGRELTARGRGFSRHAKTIMSHEYPNWECGEAGRT